MTEGLGPFDAVSNRSGVAGTGARTKYYSPYVMDSHSEVVVVHCPFCERVIHIERLLCADVFIATLLYREQLHIFT